MSTIGQIILRVALIGCCGLAVWRSVHLAVADWVASPGTVDALQDATHYAPNDARLLSRLALARNEAGDESPEVDEQLRRAAQLNPLDSNVLMTLGLREEFRGNKAKAEAYLVRAADVDHQFRPAWTLANYYARTGQTEKVWPMVERILKLDPLGFDPMSVFDLCWRETGGDAQRVQAMIPATENRRAQYLTFLIAREHPDAAMAAWPAALAETRRDDAADVARLSEFVDALLRADRAADAVIVWNQLVDRGMIASAKLDPDKGSAIADPQFRFPLTGRGFAWRLGETTAGISEYVSGGALSAEINGDEPESFQLLSGTAALTPARHYRLLWKSDGSMLKEAGDAGFAFRILQGKVSTECPALLTSKGCDFDSAPGGTTEPARIELNYKRALGTTRASGTLRVSGVRLELAS